MKVVGLVCLDSTILRRQVDPGATFKLIKTIKNKLHFKVPCTVKLGNKELFGCPKIVP